MMIDKALMVPCEILGKDGTNCRNYATWIDEPVGGSKVSVCDQHCYELSDVQHKVNNFMRGAA